VLGLHAYGRYVDRKVPIENRLYWGGPESLRGWPFFVFEGEVGYILSCEYRWPMFIMPISPQGHVLGIGAHFFLDAGNTWYKVAEDDRANVSWGGGLDFNISSLNLRFEVAWTEDGRTAFQFADRFNF
jgi:outer membrane protein assembly factor BamA